MIIPSTFFSNFVVSATNGSVDVKKSVKAFQDAFEDWLKEQGDIKPAILAELGEHDRLGEGKLVSFVMHRLNMKPNKESEDRITSALEELAKTGRVNYKTSESGRRRGRGTGYTLAGNESVRPTSRDARA